MYRIAQNNIRDFSFKYCNTCQVKNQITNLPSVIPSRDKKFLRQKSQRKGNYSKVIQTICKYKVQKSTFNMLRKPKKEIASPSMCLSACCKYTHYIVTKIRLICKNIVYLVRIDGTIYLSIQKYIMFAWLLNFCFLKQYLTAYNTK